MHTQRYWYAKEADDDGGCIIRAYTSKGARDRAWTEQFFRPSPMNLTPITRPEALSALNGSLAELKRVQEYATD